MNYTTTELQSVQEMNHIMKVYIFDRTYSTWEYAHPEKKQSFTDFLPSENSEGKKELPSPLEKKWFNQDIIEIFSLQTIHSPTRTAKYLAGILILDGNKTYGRTKNKKRLLYRCIPDDRHLPHFLVPYDLIIDFNKCHKNKYVLFRFQEWTEEHPHGLLVETLGDVNQIEVFYEYQLYSKSLHSSLKEMTENIKKMTKKKTMEEYFQEILDNPSYQIKDLTCQERPPQVFTIDPTNTVDYDDGLSIHTCPDTGFICVTVYIANVVFWLELFQLWDSFDNRIATIYLPDKRRPMLPSILTESLCSLKENTRRFAVAIQFWIDPITKKINESMTKIQNVVISPYKNYVYDESKLVHQDANYIKLLDATIYLGRNIKNSRDVVTFWMIQTNTWMAQLMIQHKTGIFRVGKYIQRDAFTTFSASLRNSTDLRSSEFSSDTEKNITTIMDDGDDELTKEERDNYLKLDSETKRYIEYHVKAKSVCYNDSLNLEHEVLQKKAYVRITSVMRRYEDVCNEYELMKLMGVKEMRREKNYNEEEIEERYKRIKKIESESEMLCRIKRGENEVYGSVYSRKEMKDGRYEYQIYIKGEGSKEIKMREKREMYKEYRIKRYIEEEKGLKMCIELDSRLG